MPVWPIALLLVSCATVQAAYPPLKHTGDPARLGQNIQRSMALMAGSTPAHRNTVRVLFYGQSITEQDWWHAVADDLRRRFPYANFVIENRALGGFSSQLLVKTAETDLYAFYPDLMIFHVYGAHNTYEDIIRRTRERTTSEVLIQTDHVTADADLNEETDASKLRPDGKIWNSFMNYKFLPEIAARYGCALVDQRNLWKQYLRDNSVHAPELLKDGVHQNAYGNFLMAEIVKSYLIRRTDTPVTPLNCSTVRTLRMGTEIKWHAGRLTVPFTGNRVDLITHSAAAVPAFIRIDGQRPSEMPELYGFTRALATPGGKWPVILKLGSQALPQLEDWTMNVTTDRAKPGRFTFTLAGSKTGPDGSGSSDAAFVSHSGRVVIDPADWNVHYSLALAGVKPVPDTFVVRFSSVGHFADKFTAPEPADRTIETTVTIAQGLQNTNHVLEITGGEAASFSAVRIYAPPVHSPDKPAGP